MHEYELEPRGMTTTMVGADGTARKVIGRLSFRHNIQLKRESICCKGILVVLVPKVYKPDIQHFNLGCHRVLLMLSSGLFVM